MENIIYIELIARRYNVDIGIVETLGLYHFLLNENSLDE